MTFIDFRGGLNHRPPGFILLAAVSLGVCSTFFASAQMAEPPPGAAIRQSLRSFREWGSVLYVAAHPDDENTELIAYLARGRGYRTVYLSVTRGDGGQNVLGSEFGEKLGVARTQELLAARRLDGGQQFFTRAIDFGFSKDYRETLRIWNREEVTADIVRVIRTFRPDVIITRFSPQPGGTHGHHTASAVLALEAFKLAGDPRAFPEQLRQLAPWQPRRIMVNGRGGGTNAGSVQLEISGDDPVLGIPFTDLAARSRAMHKTQGLGNFRGRGGEVRTESFQLLAGEPAAQDILDGIDSTWGRVSGGAEIGKMADEILSQFDTADPAASVPALLKLRSKATALPSSDSIVAEKKAQLDRILRDCLGLSVKTSISNAEVAPGETMMLHHTVMMKSDAAARWVAVRYPSVKKEFGVNQALTGRQPASLDETVVLPINTPLTQPYWLREEGGPGTYRVDDADLIGRPENPPVFPVEWVFDVNGQRLVLSDEPTRPAADSSNSAPRRLDVIPPVSLGFGAEVAIFTPGSTRPVEVEVTAQRSGESGFVELDVPAGWKAAPAKQTFHFGQAGERARLQFSVTSPPHAAAATLTARAEIDGARYSNERMEIHYPHIPLQLLQPPARLKMASFDLAIRGRKVGYLPGAGDSVSDSLRQMGCQVTALSGEDLTAERLREFDAVVIGVRAFNVRPDLEARLPGLFAYVQAGGVVVAQYNRPENGRSFKVAPYDLKLSGERVTDEDAPVTFLAPEHPVLNTPNKITGVDFSGWVQERGIYFPNEWDNHFTPILECGDPGEKPLKGGLLVAPYGRGYYVYASLVFFRQLPAGVPGAYRLLANLVSLGK